MKKLSALFLVLVFAFIVTSCAWVEKGELANKLYACDESECIEGYRFSLKLYENGEFMFSPGFLSSYVGIGKWRIFASYLVLNTEEGNVLVFDIKDDTLVFNEKSSKYSKAFYLPDGIALICEGEL